MWDGAFNKTAHVQGEFRLLRLPGCVGRIFERKKERKKREVSFNCFSSCADYLAVWDEAFNKTAHVQVSFACFSSCADYLAVWDGALENKNKQTKNNNNKNAHVQGEFQLASELPGLVGRGFQQNRPRPT